jgi:acyl-CoA synthetase
MIIETSGKACSSYEACIFSSDDMNKKLPAGEVGQIGGRGASLMLGYFADQTATQNSFNRDGWFMTGDLGWMDDKGYIRITGRKKDVIIRGGHNIYPAKIESLVMRHTSIAHAAAVPIADDRLGEKVCLVVTTKTSDTLNPDDMLRHLDEVGLSKFDMPEFYLQIDKLPLTPSGKILKRVIVDDIRDGKINPVPVRFKAS